VRAARERRDGDELGRADDVDSAVGAVFQAEDFLTGDQPMLDDPVERAADQFRCALGTHARYDPHLPSGSAAGHSALQGF
jgi:hypothetical protein